MQDTNQPSGPPPIVYSPDGLYWWNGAAWVPIQPQPQYQQQSETMVRTYKTRREMDKEVKALAAVGWRIVGQSGNFSKNMWTTSLLEREKITVTWVRP